MNTDDLIRAMATDLAPEPPMAGGLWLRLGLALGFGVVLVGVVLGYRADLGDAVLTPVSSLRFVLSLGLLAIALPMALLLGRPEGANQLRLWPLAGIAALAVLAVIWALVTTPPAYWGAAVHGSTMVWCLSSIPVLSIAPVGVLLLALRRGATGRPGLAGAIAGLAGSGGAAAAYALHCTEDNPLFYVTWYGLAIAIVTGISALIGKRMLRW